MSIEYIGGDLKDIHTAYKKRQYVKQRNAVIANVCTGIVCIVMIGAAILCALYC